MTAREEVEIQKDDGETLDPRYGKPHSIAIPKWDMHRAPWVEIGGMIHTVPSQVWEAMGQMLHHNIELKKKLDALRGETPANIPALLETYQNAVRHALRVLDDADATKAQQFMATGAEVQACQDILDVFSNLTRLVTPEGQ